MNINSKIVVLLLTLIVALLGYATGGLTYCSLYIGTSTKGDIVFPVPLFPLTDICQPCPPNQICVQVCLPPNGNGGSYNCGSMLVLTAIPKPGYKFSGWHIYTIFGDSISNVNPLYLNLIT